MSHELHTTLAAIAGYIEILELGLHGDVNPAQLANLGARQVHRIVQEMVRRVLGGAREQLGGQVDRQEAGARVDVLAAGHGGGSTRQRAGYTSPSAQRAIHTLTGAATIPPPRGFSSSFVRWRRTVIT
jgi:signal transduction histidine kinase